MVHLRPHVVHHERLSQVVLIIRIGHSFEVESHQSTAFQVSDLVLSCGRVRVHVEELGSGSSVLGEVRVLSALVVLLVVVQHMVGSGREELGETVVAEDLIKHPDFVHSGLGSSVTDSGSSDESEES